MTKLAATKQSEEVEAPRTTTGRVVAVSVETIGASLTAAASAGDTTVTVDDAAAFAETGGTVVIGGQLDDYSSVDDVTGVMVLVDPLLAAADEGDRVDLASPNGVVAQETRALVSTVGAIDSDDALDVVVHHALKRHLAEGTRDPGTGESVELTISGDEWELTAIYGLPASGSAVDFDSWSMSDNVVVRPGTHRRYNISGVPLTLQKFIASCGGGGPVGADLIIDVKKNGVSIFTSNLVIPDGDDHVIAAPDDYVLDDGEYLTVDVVQVGSTFPGNGLTVTPVVTL